MKENAKSAGWISKNVARFGRSQQAAVPFELWAQEFERKEPFWGPFNNKGASRHTHIFLTRMNSRMDFSVFKTFMAV